MPRMLIGKQLDFESIIIRSNRIGAALLKIFYIELSK